MGAAAAAKHLHSRPVPLEGWSGTWLALSNAGEN